MNNLNLQYPKKMNVAVPANEYCGDFIPEDSITPGLGANTDEDQKQMEQTVLTNTEIYNDSYAMYI
jgi:hypothetical protein